MKQIALRREGVALIVDCPEHGPQIVSGVFGGNVQIQLKNMGMQCPICRRAVPARDGMYTIAGSVLQAFQASSKNDLLKFRDIALAMQAGEASKAQADEEIAQLGSALASLWVWLNANGTAIQTIVAIITAYLMIWFQYSSDADAARLQASAEKHTQALQMILTELQKQNAAVPAQGALQPTKPQMQAPAPQQRPVKATRPNRHERLKAAALAKKNEKKAR